MKKLQKFLLNKKGVSTIEFTLTVSFFFMVLFMIFEFGRIALMSSYLDLAITNSVRITKNQKMNNGDYATLFRNTLIEQHNKLIPPVVMGLFAIKEIKIDVNVKYSDSITNLVNEKFREPTFDNDGNLVAPTGQEASIAEYSVDYKYKFFVPLPFLRSVVDSIFKRKILTVQEYERNRFNY